MKSITRRAALFGTAALALSGPAAGNPVARLRNDPDSEAIGADLGTADVTVVEFFDYQCGYCKAMLPDLQRLIAEDAKVRILLKEFPILGATSRLASRHAVAARMQGRYMALHMAMMTHKGRLFERDIDAYVDRAGIDRARLERDLKSDRVDTILANNHELAAALRIQATPSFVIGDTLVRGAVSFETIADRVAAARRTCRTC